MNYEIKLYAHGVPKGQGLWCVENLDSNYIDSFYGRKSNVPAHMLVEVRQFASTSNCYYTYFVGNTCDKDGRTGGYFALTLRINYYYADIRNIYNLLDAAFNKFIVGPIVTITNGGVRYLISDFSQADDNLKALELEINKYLMQFSSDSDFVSLNGFKANSQSEAAQLNLLECEAKTVANHVKNHGMISVSPHYLSNREQQMVQRMNEINTSAQQQINAAEKKAQLDIEAMRTQAQNEIETAQHEKEAGIQTIRNEYKEADETINSLRKALEKANNEIVRLKGKVNNCIELIKNAEAYKTKFEHSQEEAKKANDLLQKIRESLSGLNGIYEILGMNFASSKNGKANEDDPEQKKWVNKLSFMKIIRDIHPFVDFFVMIILLCVIGFSFPKSDDSLSMESQVANGRITQPEKQLKEDNKKDVVDNPYNAGEGFGENNQSSFAERFPNARIDIAEISSSKPMKYGNAVFYTVSLMNATEDLDGEWESKDFSIDNGKIKPNHAGKCKISYVP